MKVKFQNELYLTQRGNEVFMGTQGLHAAFVLVVPDPNGFVISTAHYESSSGVKQYSTHPVVMTNLNKEDQLATTSSQMSRIIETGWHHHLD